MKKNTVSSFIEKTWEILFHEQNWSIVRWSNDGNSFEIVDELRFSSELLPTFFKHCNFSSFIRQLNMYNFHKRKNLDGSFQFYHKLFRKDQKQLLIGIKRKPSEAQIMFGDQLIRQLAPQCLKDTYLCRVENLEVESFSEKKQNLCSDYVMTFQENESQKGMKVIGKERSIFGLIQCHINNQNQWPEQKRLPIIILKTPPRMF